MNTKTMSNAALAITAIIDAERALTHDDLRILARHLSDRLGVCDAETLGGMLAPDLLGAADKATRAVEPTLDARFLAILARIHAITTLDDLRACEEEVDAGRRAGLRSSTCGTLLNEISKREDSVLQGLMSAQPEHTTAGTP